MADSTTGTDRAQPPAASTPARAGRGQIEDDGRPRVPSPPARTGSRGARPRRFPEAEAAGPAPAGTSWSGSGPSGTTEAAGSAGRPPAGRKRLPASERRAQLLEVAIAVFGRRGFRGATTRVIAEAAGVSEATIFRHFPSKDDLYVAAFRKRTEVGTEQLVEVLQGHADRQDDEGLLRTLIGAVFLGYEQDRDLHRMLLYAWLDQEQAANRRMWEQMRTHRLFGFLERYVARRQAQGVFRPGDPVLLSAALLALPVHHAVQTKLYGIGSDARDEEVAELYARFLLAGLRAAGPGAPPGADPGA